MTRKRQSQGLFFWKRGVKVCAWLIFLSSIFLTGEKLQQITQFPIQQVKIYGGLHLNQNAIESLLRPLVSKGFFAVEVDAIKEQLLQQAWVSEVSVRRVWPNEIRVLLTERKPVARWNETSLLSSTGDIFSPDVRTFPADLPRFSGPEGKQVEVLAFYFKTEHVLQPLHLRVRELELTPYLSWNMAFDNGMKVHAGYKDVLTRLSHFVKVYPQIVGNHAAQVDYVDLRYSNGLAVRWLS